LKNNHLEKGQFTNKQLKNRQLENRHLENDIWKIKNIQYGLVWTGRSGLK